jgi:hypothetical protein
VVAAGAATGPVRWLDHVPAGVLAYQRHGLLVAANTDDHPRALRLPDPPAPTARWSQAFSTVTAAEPDKLATLEQHDEMLLAPLEAVILTNHP